MTAALVRPVIVQARIKKIMQTDEEVGKIAQATPVLVCKAPSHQITNRNIAGKQMVIGCSGNVFLIQLCLAGRTLSLRHQPYCICDSKDLDTSLLLLRCEFFSAAKALEMFLQDLCRKTYEIAADRGAKTVSEAHL